VTLRRGSVVGDAIGTKAAEGIRRLETLKALYHLGARRFGIGHSAVQPTLAPCMARNERE
jgi:deoxyribose-phosphate aldolase